MPLTNAEKEQRFKNMPSGPLPWPKDYVLIDNYDADTDEMDDICLARGVVRLSSKFTDLAYRRFYKCTYRNCNYRILSYQNAERGAIYEKFEHNHGQSGKHVNARPRTSVSVQRIDEPINEYIDEHVDEHFDIVVAQSRYKLNLLDRYDDSKPMLRVLRRRGISRAEKNCSTKMCQNYVVRKYYHGADFNVKFMSLQRNGQFALYQVNGVKASTRALDNVNTIATDGMDVTASLGDTSIRNLQNTTADGSFARWLQSIDDEENDAINNSRETSTRLDENHKRDYQNATPLLALEDVTAASVGKVQKHDIQEVALAVDNPLLESLVPEKWKLMGRYDDFHTLDEVRKAKNVRCCRMEVKDGITEKYYRCYSCNYKMWSRERGDKCVLYYSGQHNHPFEQLDVKPEIPHTTDSVTSDVLKPPTVSKVVPIVVNLSDPDTQIINGALAEVKCTPFSCYSLSCLTQIAVEFGLQLILDDFNQGQFSLRKCDFLIKFVITEAAITIIFREGADLTHSESRASMDWGRFLTAIRTKCTNFFKN